MRVGGVRSGTVLRVILTFTYQNKVDLSDIKKTPQRPKQEYS